MLTVKTLHPATPSQHWWEHAVFYQIYPRSFADSSGNGVGDIQGILRHLDYLVDLGIDGLWLSPFYPSPQKDGGYDVTDYCAVDPLFGELGDFDELISNAHERGLKIIVDIVPNHTSDQHSWFQQALRDGPGSAFRDMYMFRDGKGPQGDEPPNNWTSVFDGPAWTRVCDRADARDSAWEADTQWYLHLYDSSQPDLDWNCSRVRQAFPKILQFWLDRGVDGFRVDVAHGLVKHEDLPDWEGNPFMIPREDPRALSRPMFDQDGVHEIYRDWRKLLEEYGKDRILVAEAGVANYSRLARYVRPDEMHQAFNMLFLRCRWTPRDVLNTITKAYREHDAVGAPTTWVLNNHDIVRHASRLGMPPELETRIGGIGPNDTQPDQVLGLLRARSATLLMLALPGGCYLYQGEELGLPEHTCIEPKDRQDPQFFRSNGASIGRDGCRIPLPWNSTEPAAGFSPTGRTWLPQPENWNLYAPDRQIGDPTSTLEMYRHALSLRKELGIGGGAYAIVPEFSERAVVAQISTNTHTVMCVTTFDEPIELEGQWKVLICSLPAGIEALEIGSTGCVIPAHTTVWMEKN